MAKLYFIYSTMNAGKSIEVLKVAHNYEEMGKKVMVLTPKTDNRNGVGVVSSRIGINRNAIPVGKTDNLYELVSREDDVACVIVDEAQFLSGENVIQLTDVVDYLNIPVMCYGLKDDFRKELFEGSKYLLLYADKIEEIRTICWCGKKATVNARIVDGKIVRQGEQIQIGGNESYIPLCRKHYKEGKISNKENDSK